LLKELVEKFIIATPMTSQLTVKVGLLTFLCACMSTAPKLGVDASAWDNYLSWYKASPELMTADPTGFLKMCMMEQAPIVMCR